MTTTGRTTTTTSIDIPQITYTEVKPITKTSSLEEFRALVKKGTEPVAYRIAGDEAFPAFQKWNEKHWAHSTLKVVAHECTSPRLFDLVRSKLWQLATCFLPHKLTLGDYVRKLQQHRLLIPHNPIGSLMLSGTEMYLRHNYANNQAEFQELLPDLQGMDRFFATSSETEDCIRTIGLWVSCASISSQTHFDSEGDHNLNFQIQGQKLFTLYAHQDGIQHLYPLVGRTSNLSLVDPYHPKVLEEFPLVRKAQPYTIQLQAGEVLFIPKLWWHDIRHLGEFNINLTAWFNLEGKRLPREKKGPYMAGTGLRDTLVAWFYLIKAIVAMVVARVLTDWIRLYTSNNWRMEVKNQHGSKNNPAPIGT